MNLYFIIIFIYYFKHSEYRPFTELKSVRYLEPLHFTFFLPKLYVIPPTTLYDIIPPVCVLQYYLVLQMNFNFYVLNIKILYVYAV